MKLVCRCFRCFRYQILQMHISLELRMRERIDICWICTPLLQKGRSVTSGCNFRFRLSWLFAGRPVPADRTPDNGVRLLISPLGGAATSDDDVTP